MRRGWLEDIWGIQLQQGQLQWKKECGKREENGVSVEEVEPANPPQPAKGSLPRPHSEGTWRGISRSTVTVMVVLSDRHSSHSRRYHRRRCRYSSHCRTGHRKGGQAMACRRSTCSRNSSISSHRCKRSSNSIINNSSSTTSTATATATSTIFRRRGSRHDRLSES